MDAVVDRVLDVDAACLSHEQRLDLLAEIEHVRSALDAAQQSALAVIAASRQHPKDFVREEVACTLRIAPITAGQRLNDATTLVHDLPRTHDRLLDGTLSMGHVRALIEGLRTVDDPAVVAKVEARVLARCEGKTIGEFRQAVRRAVASLNPVSEAQEHADELAERRVVMTPVEKGMATIWAYLAADRATALMSALDAHASELGAALDDDGRTADQKRADVLADLADLALHAAPTTWQGRKPTIQVTVDLSTLLGLTEHPADLDGYGPIPAAMARTIAADHTGTWQRLITDHTGAVLDCSPTYTPPAKLRDKIIARDRTCRFPGCRRTARRCDIDHLQPWSSGGTTTSLNLHCLCSRHHHLKHEAGWDIHRRADGTTMWTTPAGRRFEKPPDTPIGQPERVSYGTVDQ